MRNLRRQLELSLPPALAVLLMTGCAAPAISPTAAPRADFTASPIVDLTATPTATVKPTATSTPTAVPFVLPLPPGISATRNVPYTTPVGATASEWLLDVYAPEEPGDGPVVVILHGAGGSKDESELQSLAHSIAEGGAVALVPSNRPEGGDTLFRDDRPALREYLENTTCAIRFARQRAREHGGNPERVIAIGHSGGGYTGMWIGLVGDDLEPVWDGFASDHGGPAKQVDCVAGDQVSARPDVFIGFAGAYVYYEQFSAEDPELFEVVNPVTYIGRNQDVVIRIIEATRDETRPAWANESTRQLYERLAAAGYDVELTEIVAGHGLGLGAREAIVQVLWETIGPSQ